MGGQWGGWGRSEAAVALKNKGILGGNHPPLGAVVRLLNLRGLAEQQQRQSGQVPTAQNRADAAASILRFHKKPNGSRVRPCFHRRRSGLAPLPRCVARSHLAMARHPPTSAPSAAS